MRSITTLAFLLKAQYPNGAWPALPRAATAPTTPSTTTSAIASHRLAAHRHTGRASSLEAAKRAGEFILKAQQPEPAARPNSATAR